MAAAADVVVVSSCDGVVLHRRKPRPLSIEAVLLLLPPADAGDCHASIVLFVTKPESVPIGSRAINPSNVLSSGNPSSRHRNCCRMDGMQIAAEAWSERVGTTRAEKLGEQ